MSSRCLAVLSLSAAMCVVVGPAVDAQHDFGKHDMPTGLVKAVRDATQDFRDVRVAMNAGYASLGTCVTGPERGAMGVHFAKNELIGDGVVDASSPELLVYEPRDGRMRLVAVEFIVLADQWDVAHPDGPPPVLMGQHFQFVNAPNRYRLPAFYELHVWAWRDNPFGAFVDWNPDVSCAAFNPDGSH
jgi:hypothetical protein